MFVWQLSDNSIYGQFAKMSKLLLVLLFLKYDISVALSSVSKVVKTPNNDLFITGRGCGTETPIKYLNYFPQTLRGLECSFIQTNQTKSNTSKLDKEIQALQQWIVSFQKECIENDHVNNLIGAHSKSINGWTFANINSFQMDPLNNYYKKCGNGQFWFGFGPSTIIGSIETQLKGCGYAVLDFGNCNWGNSWVYVYLNDEKLATAGKNTQSMEVGFYFKEGSVLKLIESQAAAIIKFNRFDEIHCGC